MDLIYKIYSVYLYDNQLNHDWLFFYNRKTDFMGNINRDAPYYMFGSSDFCASTQIYRMDKTAPDFLEQSVRLMKAAANKEGIELISGKDIITLVPLEEGRVSYSGALPGDVVETEGKYKGLKKSIYTPYNVMFNETKAGFNPHEFEVMGIWNAGSSQYSNYRIWEEKAEREGQIRDYKLQELLNENSLY
jgi:hypothetical protein